AVILQTRSTLIARPEHKDARCALQEQTFTPENHS
ncbi:MAG: hypothetical protein ACI9K9_000569, partial [Neolewinella sp.]